MNRTYFYISMTTIVTAFVMMVVAIFWLIYPYKTIEFNKPEAVVETKQVARGDYLVYVIDYCKYTEKEANISRSFIDGLIYLTPDGIADVPKGCGEKRIQMYVPRNMPVGKYRIMQVRHYEVNPLRHIDIVYYTEEFEVL